LASELTEADQEVLDAFEVNPAQKAAREHVPLAIQTLKDVAEKADAPPGARVSAASKILETAYGKPGMIQIPDATGGGGIVVNILNLSSGKQQDPITLPAEVIDEDA
jgi:hypothetical protein